MEKIHILSPPVIENIPDMKLQSLNKKIKRVISCFKESNNKVGRVDRDLQEVFDAQLYIVEELLHQSSEEGGHGLENMISDYNFILDKALKSIFMSSDNSTSTYQTPSAMTKP